MSYGQDGRVAISFQNSYGTANVASLHHMEPISESVNLSIAQLTQKGLHGIYDMGGAQAGIKTVAGDLIVEAKANQLGVMLAATNAAPTTVTSSALYTHTFKPRQSDAQALCAERPFTYLKYLGDTGSAHEYYDMNANTLELSISNGEMLTSKISMVGGSFARVAAVSATYSESNPLDWSVSSVSLSGSGVTNVRALTITQDNKLATKHMVTSGSYPNRIKRTDFRSITVGGTLVFDDQTSANMFITQSEQRLAVFMKGTSLVQSGYYESLLIDIPSLRFTEHPISIGGPGEIEVGFKADAKYNVGSATAIAYTIACGKAGF